MKEEIPPQELFKALADDCRLRVLRAVSLAELSVAELVRVLGLPQSTVSRHLKPLRECGLLGTRRDGTSVYYHRGEAFADADLASLLERQMALVPGEAEDRASVRRVLDQRRSHNRAFFDEVAGRYGSLTEPGGGWPALAAGLATGFSGKVVADLGAGEGALTLLLARACKRVIAVDLSPNMLATLRAAADRAGVGRVVETVEGDLERLPLANSVADTVFLSQALHHAAEPAKALAEAARILKPGGTLVLLDLCAHEQEWVREEYADVWLGFSTETLLPMLSSVGLNPDQPERLPGATPELPVLFVTATKP